ncbi:MAG TPA: histidine kinase dimerization/phospho-acceptor domain-containing protein, partial [Vicinamibacteria bacterium]|nr:histidine kinase dimerization/phospho-acceptor domain-containing protein [Vicinamibacteria bacterium]
MGEQPTGGSVALSQRNRSLFTRGLATAALAGVTVGTLYLFHGVFGSLAEAGLFAALVALSLTLGVSLARHRTRVVHADRARYHESLTNAVVESITDGVIVTDAHGTIRLVNSRAREILDLGSEPLVGRSLYPLVECFESLSDEVVIKEALERIVERGESLSTEVRLSHPGTRQCALHLRPVKSSEGRVEGIVSTLSEVTQSPGKETRTDLLSMVKDEIRTPLATIRGFAQILLNRELETAKAREFLGIIHKQSNRLVDLVNDCVDIARIESGRRVITREPVDLIEIIENAVADLRPLAAEKRITLHYEPPYCTVPSISGDRNLIEQVLINLISNAIKYSSKGAWARVEVTRTNGHVAVAVADNGLGIPRDALPRIFEKFYRVRCDDREDII